MRLAYVKSCKLQNKLKCDFCPMSQYYLAVRCHLPTLEEKLKKKCAPTEYENTGHPWEIITERTRAL